MSNGKKKKMKKMVCAAAAGMMTMSFIMPAFAQDTAITPKKAVYGYLSLIHISEPTRP